MKIWPLLLPLLLMCASTAGFAQTKKFKTPDKKVFKARKKIKQLLRHQNRVSCGMGIHIFDESGLTIGQQVGFPITNSGRWFVGPEYRFTLFPTGKLLNLAIGTWYDIPFSSSARAVGVTLGAGGGVSFPEQLPRVDSVSYVAFADLAVFQAVNRFTRIRGQVRAEWIGGLPTIVTSFNVVFRF